MIGIYKITNTINGKCYIGQSRDIESRWRAHKVRKGTYLYNAFQKYGVENFTFEVLEECEKERLNELEKYYIKLYHSFGEGYNLCPGGNSDPEDFDAIRKEKLSKAAFGRKSPMKGKHHTDDAKEKLRNANLGHTPWNKGVSASDEAKKKMSEAHKGKSHPHRKLTEEEKLKISKSLIGKKQSEETKKKRSLSLKGRTMSEEQKKKISLANKGKKKNISKHREGFSIMCITTNEKCVSMNECCKKHHISKNTLRKLLETGEKSKDGLIYKYEGN